MDFRSFFTDCKRRSNPIFFEQDLFGKYPFNNVFGTTGKFDLQQLNSETGEMLKILCG